MPDPVEQQLGQGAGASPDPDAILGAIGNEPAQTPAHPQPEPTVQPAPAQPQPAAPPETVTAQPQTSPPTAPQAPVSQAPATQQPADPILAAAQAQGMNVQGYQSGEEFLGALRSSHQEFQQYAQMGREVAPHWDQVQGVITRSPGQSDAQQQEPTAPPAEGEWNEDDYFQSVWNMPQWDPVWDTLIQQGRLTENHDGTFSSSTPDFAGVARALNEYMVESQRVQAERRSVNPYQDVWNNIQEPLKRLLAEHESAQAEQYQQWRAQQHVEDAITHLRQELGPHLHVYGDPLNPSRVTGNTDYGQKFYDQWTQLESQGIQAPDHVMVQLIRQTIGNPPGLQQQQQPAAAGNGQPGAQPLSQATPPAVAAASAPGVVAQPAAAPQTPTDARNQGHASFLEQAAARTNQQAGPQQTAYGPTPTPRPMTDADVDNILEEGLNQAQSAQ